MTRINTNVSSLVGRNNLQSANSSLSQSLTRLSTGLRINTGKDDPAGLIASENLRSDITSIGKAISNTDRANQVIATADSALGQVSSLLNDIRGLVTESANAGALSEDQIDANQLQVDSSLAALNRIAQTTTFQGRRLLDGSLDFQTSQGANSANVSNLQIDQANLGATGQVSVDVNVTTAATQATVEVGSLPDVTPPASGAVTFDIETTAAVGSTGSVDFDIITGDTTQGNGDFTTTAAGSLVINGETIDLTATSEGAAGNAAITAASVTFSAGSGNEASTFGGGTLALSVESAEGAADIDEIIAAINADSGTTGISATLASGSTGTTTFDETTNSEVSTGTLNDLVGGGQIDLAAVEDGTADGVSINGLTTVTVNYGAGSADASFDGTTLTVDVTQAQGVATLADITSAIDAGGDIDATLSSGSGVFAAVGTVTADGDGAAETRVTESINITGTTSAGASGDIDISFAEAALGGSNPTTNVIGNASTGYTVQINTDIGAGVSLDDIRVAVQSISEVDTAAFANATTGPTRTYNAVEVGGAATPEAAPSTTSLTSGVDQVITSEAINITTAVGFIGNLSIGFAEANLSGTPTNLITNGTNDYTIQIDNTGAVTLENIRSAIEGLSEVATAAFTNAGAGTQTYDATTDAPPTPPTLLTGAGAGNGVNGIAEDLVFELAGVSGSEVLTFEANTSLALLVNGINAVSDATGVTATANSGDDGLVLTSSEYGTDSFVDVQIIDEGTGATNSGAFTTALGEGSRSTGDDIIASVNGITANGDGNDLSINTATLDLSATITADFVGTANFTITGGGALFQLGPDVVSNQQARLGIGSVNTAALGGNDGLLFQLGSGEAADLSSDANKAASIVEDAINQVTSLRGRLGAFQRTTLETNKNALNDTLSNLTEAESSIRDADFATETAELTRSQILVQSGTRVLAIANQNPQNVLSLLG